MGWEGKPEKAALTMGVGAFGSGLAHLNELREHGRRQTWWVKAGRGYAAILILVQAIKCPSVPIQGVHSDAEPAAGLSTLSGCYPIRGTINVPKALLGHI